MIWPEIQSQKRNCSLELTKSISSNKIITIKNVGCHARDVGVACLNLATLGFLLFMKIITSCIWFIKSEQNAVNHIFWTEILKFPLDQVALYDWYLICNY